MGAVGLVAPRTLGVGYGNIQEMLAGDLSIATLGLLCGAKLVSWLFALGSGSSGGTLAPLFTIGGALGALLTYGVASVAPGYGIDPRIGALVGMAAMFGGASRALLTSVIFAFEATRQPLGLLPLLGGCSAAYFVSCVAMRNSIMTEKLARRGMRVDSEYALDYLQRVLVSEQATTSVVTFSATDTVDDAREFFASRAEGAAHNGFPVVDENEHLIGVLTKRDLLMTDVDPRRTLAECIKRAPVVVNTHHTLREACDQMVEHRVGRVVVVDRKDPKRIVGILTRSDLLTAHERRLGALRQYQGSVIMATARRRVGRRAVHSG